MATIQLPQRPTVQNLLLMPVHRDYAFLQQGFETIPFARYQVYGLPLIKVIRTLHLTVSHSFLNGKYNA